MSSRKALGRARSWELHIAILRPSRDEVGLIEEICMSIPDEHGLAAGIVVRNAPTRLWWAYQLRRDALKGFLHFEAIMKSGSDGALVFVAIWQIRRVLKCPSTRIAILP